ncbi:hypothetical protein PNEG_01589 [Pneumocystis murina B123]|uniref:rRNA-processing protein EBP2 n=1 Tax=Pneumocystis murina (strain B123) TaxID=1069680 RepID=M7NNS1_PNEMU|nr:hypothetical protein PNEG_01589 [Pneumocystis murina B123]EMR10333.1 hypothetical protein PNEG_01589 [Pneumocystis murina B123]
MDFSKKKDLKAPFKAKKDLNDGELDHLKTEFIEGEELNNSSEKVNNKEIFEEKKESDDESLEEEILLSEVESFSDFDVPIYQKLTINNKEALNRIFESIIIPETKFDENQVITSKESIKIENIHDDFARELAFYKQGLEAAIRGRQAILDKNGIFSRPYDYFAEMLKSDEHMQKIKDKLIKEETEKKAIESARRQRELKKIGKKVQIEKIHQRHQEKKEILDKIKNLKKKRKYDQELTTDDNFDVELEKASSVSKRQKTSKRQKKDKNYGFDGKKKYKKSNDTKSTDSMFEFSVKKMKQPFKNYSNIQKKTRRKSHNK